MTRKRFPQLSQHLELIWLWLEEGKGPVAFLKDEIEKLRAWQLESWRRKEMIIRQKQNLRVSWLLPESTQAVVSQNNKVSKGEEIVSMLLVRSMGFPDIDDPENLSLYRIVTQRLVCQSVFSVWKFTRECPRIQHQNMSEGSRIK